MKYVLIVAALLLGGCSEPSQPKDKAIVDQCLRSDLFKQCLQLVPKGPERIGTSNDWDEVVSECGQQSYYQSLRPKSVVKVECKSGL